MPLPLPPLPLPPLKPPSSPRCNRLINPTPSLERRTPALLAMMWFIFGRVLDAFEEADDGVVEEAVDLLVVGVVDGGGGGGGGSNGRSNDGGVEETPETPERPEWKLSASSNDGLRR